MLPSARLLRSGLWRIDVEDGAGAQDYDHDGALALASYATGTTSNGFPLDLGVGEAGAST